MGWVVDGGRVVGGFIGLYGCVVGWVVGEFIGWVVVGWMVRGFMVWVGEWWCGWWLGGWLEGSCGGCIHSPTHKRVQC